MSLGLTCFVCTGADKIDEKNVKESWLNDNMHNAELYGRVLRVNRAKPMQHKLGDAKPVWSAEEWFKMNLKDDPELAASMRAWAADVLRHLQLCRVARPRLPPRPSQPSIACGLWPSGGSRGCAAAS